jgi:hypothetical protein
MEVAQDGISYERRPLIISSRVKMPVVGLENMESRRRREANSSTADKISAGHPIGVTAEELEVHVEGSVDRLVSAPGFAREDPKA